MDDVYYPMLSAPGAFWTPTFVLAGMFAVRYLLFAGIAWGLGYRNVAASRRRKLQLAMPHAAQIRREFAYSALAVALFGAINGTLTFAGIVPHTQVYRDIAQHGWQWFVLSIALALVVHDRYFYWTHRLLQVRAIFPSFTASIICRPIRRPGRRTPSIRSSRSSRPAASSS